MKHRTIGLILATVLVAGFIQQAQAAALVKDKAVTTRKGAFIELGVASNALLYAGSLVAVNSSGLAVPASDTASLRVLGFATDRVDNRTYQYDSRRVVRVERGVVLLVNSGAFTDADIGEFAYVADDQSVTTAATAAQDIPAGIIQDVTTAGVFVEIGPLSRALAGAFDSLAVSGNGSVGGTLAVTGAATLSSTLDVDSVTVDAGAGVDTQAAGVLAIGAANATSVALGASDAGVTVPGTLAVTGVATHTVAPKYTVVTAPAAQTLTMTNGPSVTATAAPTWVNATIGSTTYVIPAWAKP